MYFIVQTFILWYQYYGNRETNITQCSQKLASQLGSLLKPVLHTPICMIQPV